MHPLISIVTLTHNKLAVTARCLTTLLQTEYPNWEMIIIDNGSSDGTPDWLDEFTIQAEARDFAVTVHRNDTNIGCSTARNQGIERASGSYLVFIDNDVALRTRSWLEGLLRALEAEPSGGMIGPKLVYPYPPHDIQCAGVGISKSGRVQFRGRGEPRDTPRFSRPEEVQCLISACVMFTRTVLDECGGFDEAFNPVEYEDFDLVYRARERGYSAHYLPSVEMYHFESVTTADTESLPNTYLIIKHGMLFKQRWRHLFENEAGPSDDETHWRKIELPAFESVTELPAL
jgi:GT2 family glycosyltransferase